MNQNNLSSFLTLMFEDRKLFADVNGTANTMDAKYMLVADALSENISLLSEVIGEQFKLNLNNIKTLELNKSQTSVAF